MIAAGGIPDNNGNSDAEERPQERPGKDHKERGEEPGRDVGIDMVLAHLPVVVDLDRTDDAENGRQDKRKIESGEEVSSKIVPGFLHLRDAGLRRSNKYGQAAKEGKRRLHDQKLTGRVYSTASSRARLNSCLRLTPPEESTDAS